MFWQDISPLKLWVYPLETTGIILKPDMERGILWNYWVLWHCQAFFMRSGFRTKKPDPD